MKRKFISIAVGIAILAIILLVFLFLAIEELYWTTRCKNALERDLLHYTYVHGLSSQEVWLSKDNFYVFKGHQYNLYMNGERYWGSRSNNGVVKWYTTENHYAFGNIRNVMKYDWQKYAYSGCEHTENGTTVHFSCEDQQSIRIIQKSEFTFHFDTSGSLLKMESKQVTYEVLATGSLKSTDVIRCDYTFHNTNPQDIKFTMEEAYVEAKAATG